MVHKTFLFFAIFFCIILFVAPDPFPYNAQLDYHFYDTSCPNLALIVRWGVWAAVKSDSRMGASLLRLYFHDCFVNVIFSSFSDSFMISYFCAFSISLLHKIYKNTLLFVTPHSFDVV